MIQIIPAVDIKDGRCVRLFQGRADQVRVYWSDPVAAARRWEREGAAIIHVVDLDAALSGRPVNREIVRAIIKDVSVSVQVGGGLREENDIEDMLRVGAARVVLGTRAIRDPAWLAAVVKRWGDAIVVGLDARGGRVHTQGWRYPETIGLLDCARRIEDCGVRAVIYTDVNRDGTRSGPDLQGIGRLCDTVRMSVIASGGIGSGEDVAKLRDLRRSNLIGAIVGRALYEGNVTLAGLKGVAGGNESQAAGHGTAL